MSFITPPFVISILVALTLHECAHGIVAYWLGDPTAKNEGRLTLNPLAHLDLLGTMMFLMVGFGWAKPVPVNPQYFRGSIKRGMTLTALAGPATNLLIAIATVFIAKFIFMLNIQAAPGVARFFSELFQSMLFINLGLMAFNLLPIAPLDGSKILAMFIPYQYEATYEEFLRNGPFILLFLIIGERMLGIPLLIGWITAIIYPILNVLEKLL